MSVTSGLMTLYKRQSSGRKTKDNEEIEKKNRKI